MPFPHLDDQEEVLTDWIAELAETDGYYAGLAETLIMGKPIQIKDHPSLEPLFKNLNSLRDQSSISESRYRECEHYLLALDKLVRACLKNI